MLPSKVMAALDEVPTVAGYNDGLSAVGSSSQDLQAQLSVSTAKATDMPKVGSLSCNKAVRWMHAAHTLNPK